MSALANDGILIDGWRISHLREGGIAPNYATRDDLLALIRFHLMQPKKAMLTG